MWIYEREGASGEVFITLRLPKRLWDAYEYRHKHFGVALHNLRIVVTDLLAAHYLTRVDYTDKGDPFYR